MINPPPKAFAIAGVRIDDVTTSDVLACVEQFVQAGGLHRLVTPNVDLVLHARADERYRRVLNSSALSIPDGMGLLRGARLLGVKFRENVTGRLLVRPLCELAAKKGWKIYILASANGIAPIAAAKLVQDYPGLQIVGARSPSFSFFRDPSEIEDVLRDINAQAPDLLFVGLGSPRGEQWIFDYADRLPVKVAIGVGYAFDVIAGKIRECPRWMTRHGVEWAYRLAKEPKRLWRRYLVRDPQFFIHVLRQRFSGQTTAWSADVPAHCNHHDA